ncbi:hypothetical protein [Burkholderia sola]|uniref:hypothetical protein n=1 Tax=Burkholderia sola TaxID=2843302 RepID=UPI0023DD9636|nr:hypothetical protein [Burkholderia sola]MDF3084533.1 hypothetical protein [Burkholderia sola]
MSDERGRCLSVVLLENIDFDDLVKKIENAFGVSLLVSDKKGRYVAAWEGGDFSIEVIDRVDRLGDFLSDDSHVIDFFVNPDNNSNLEFEGKIKSILKEGGIKWARGVWSQVNRGDDFREIYPNFD